MKKLIFKTVGALMCLVSLLFFAKIKWEERNQKEKYEIIASAYEETPAGPGGDDDVSPGCVGWISINSADILYPLMQANDNEYYLTHDSLDNEDRNGSIFVDYHMDLEEDQYCVIYGHNMITTNSMFHQLYNVKIDDAMTIRTEDGNKNYHCIAVYDTTVKDSAFRVYTDESELLQFVNSAMKNCDQPEIDGLNNKQIIACVTCNRNFCHKDGRRIVLFMGD